MDKISVSMLILKIKEELMILVPHEIKKYIEENKFLLSVSLSVDGI